MNKEKLNKIIREIASEISNDKSLPTNEMARTDFHYTAIMDIYDSSSFGKKKVGAVVCNNPNATFKQIQNKLDEASYKDIIEFTNTLGIKEGKSLSENTSNSEILDVIDVIHNLINKIKTEDAEKGAKLFTAAGPLIKELHTLVESVEIVNEAFDEKDEKRISDITTKGRNDKSLQRKLATSMAKKITDVNKAIRRGDAATELKVDYIATIFYNRANELKGLAENEISKSKEAHQLKKGDILTGSNLEIVSVSAGAKTPSGKIDVTVKNPTNGKEVTKTWGKYTKVSVQNQIVSIKENENEDIKVDDRLFDIWTSDKYGGVSKYGKSNNVDIYDAADAIVYFDWIKEDKDKMVKKLISFVKGEEHEYTDEGHVSYVHAKRVK